MARFVVLCPFGLAWWVLQIDGIVAQRIAEVSNEAAAHRMADLFNRNGMEDVPLEES